MNKALLIIDAQNDYFPGGKSELFHAEIALSNIENALALFRANNLPVIHVQHINTRKGATFFLPETEGVKIHKNLVPKDNEHVVIKHYPNSFLQTNLAEILIEHNISHLVICGMMSHMCVDTTTRACMDFAIKPTLLSDACATKDLTYAGNKIPAETVHNAFMASLSGMFAAVIKTADLTI
ncbi:MAG: cysteine hydrolase [Clostridiales bacterium 43-6]|nr:MAG: cysteine hydrolase [Clostridiales bacterium 43-6]